jgi:hypothetical protein
VASVRVSAIFDHSRAFAGIFLGNGPEDFSEWVEGLTPGFSDSML